MQEKAMVVSRRKVLNWIGVTAGAAAMYQAMTALSFAAESNYERDFALSGAPKGTRVLILGAGLAGMTAAYELRKAGYQVKVLEFNAKPGGRCWTLRGGDRFTELGGATQHCEFDKGLYLNPGPWRIPYHHHAVLDYCHKFGVALEPFIQVNYNAMVHSTQAFEGKPQRYRAVQADFQGHVAELLSKAVNQHGLDQALTREDRERLLEVMRKWGALDSSNAYKKSLETSMRRGFAVDDGGGLMPAAVASEPIDCKALLDSNLWQSIASGPFQLFGRKHEAAFGYQYSEQKFASDSRAADFGTQPTATSCLRPNSLNWPLACRPKSFCVVWVRYEPGDAPMPAPVARSGTPYRYSRWESALRSLRAAVARTFQPLSNSCSSVAK